MSVYRSRGELHAEDGGAREEGDASSSLRPSAWPSASSSRGQTSAVASPPQKSAVVNFADSSRSLCAHPRRASGSAVKAESSSSSSNGDGSDAEDQKPDDGLTSEERRERRRLEYDEDDDSTNEQDGPGETVQRELTTVEVHVNKWEPLEGTNEKEVSTHPHSCLCTVCYPGRSGKLAICPGVRLARAYADLAFVRPHSGTRSDCPSRSCTSPLRTPRRRTWSLPSLSSRARMTGSPS